MTGRFGATADGDYGRAMLDAGLFMVAAERVTGALGDHAAPDALEARRMQAISLAVHVPIVCFGIAFPAMFLFVHGLYLRTGKPHYTASRCRIRSRCWSPRPTSWRSGSPS